MNRRPTDEQLGEMLKAPHFGSGSSLPSTDPIVATPMVLTLDQIKPYDRNPRRERNPLYEEIKESILAKGGLNNPFNVTRRPGEAIYMIESGGNTRLQILNELHRETGDERYYRLHVLYQPWKSESHVLTAHLIENEKRGEMLFIDKALAIRELKGIYEQELGESLSLRALLERLKQDGFTVNLNLLSRIDYAIDVLLPAIPEALRAGMGRPTIERIRQVERAFASYWSDNAGQDDTLFGEIFSDALAENNRADWDSEALRSALELRLIDLLDIPLRSLRLDIDALLYEKRNHPESINVTDASQQIVAKPAFLPQPHNAEIAPHTPHTSAECGAAASHLTKEPDNKPLAPSPSTSSSPEGDVQKASPAHQHDHLHDFRKQVHEAAFQLADAYDLTTCIEPSPHWGLGFVVDLPAETLSIDESSHLDAKTQWERVIRQWVWWMLYLCSEQTAQPDRIPNLPQSSRLRRHLLEGNHNTLQQHLGQPAWQVLSYQLLADPLFPEEAFDQLIRLIRLCRTLRQWVGSDDDDRLWLERSVHAPS